MPQSIVAPERALDVAAVQMAVVDGDPEANLEVALALAGAAAGAGSRLVLLPELWTTGYSHARWPEVATSATGQVLAAIGRFCADHDVYLGGSMIERGEAGLVNRFRLIGPDGATRVVYDKAHLFPPMLEDRHLVAGSARARLDVDGWRASPSICFDLRFPEMYRYEAVAGANLFLVPSEWPAERAHVMRGLAWARAVENQAFLVLCNRAGRADDGTDFGGGSMIVAPDGSILAEAGGGEEIIRATLDPAALELRDRLPVLTARVDPVDTHP